MHLAELGRNSGSQFIYISHYQTAFTKLKIVRYDPQDFNAC